MTSTSINVSSSFSYLLFFTRFHIVKRWRELNLAHEPSFFTSIIKKKDCIISSLQSNTFVNTLNSYDGIHCIDHQAPTPDDHIIYIYNLPPLRWVVPSAYGTLQCGLEYIFLDCKKVRRKQIPNTYRKAMTLNGCSTCIL